MDYRKIELLRMCIAAADATTLNHESSEFDTHAAIVILKNDSKKELNDGEIAFAAGKVAEYFAAKTNNPRMIPDFEILEVAHVAIDHIDEGLNIFQAMKDYLQAHNVPEWNP